MAERPFSPVLARLILFVVFTGAIAAGWFFFVRESPPQADPSQSDPVVRPDQPVPDPRIAFDTPFRNVKPGVKYTGDASCAGCHPNHDANYHKHPMGRSADRVGRPDAPEKYDANNPFRSQGYTLRAERSPHGDRHIVSATDPSGQPLPDHIMLATVAIGSGTRGRSYLAVEESAVYQTPVSWYGQTMQKWDLSPSYDMGTGGRRMIQKECLYCHVNHVEAVPGSLNRILKPFPEQLNVGCERCHGPGELHVRERSDGANPPAPDTSIVNPKHLSPELRSSICQQCHLQGEERVARRGRDLFEFRPGLPWEQFVSVFVRHPAITDFHKSVGQFDQMHTSRCFTGSGGKLDCTSCHDAHGKPEPAESDAFYRSRCNTCHDSKGCTAPAPERAAKADSCIACHMTRNSSSNIVHTAVTDHRVLRRPETTPPAKRGLPFDADPVVPFAPTRFAPPLEERDRDLAIAYANVIGKMTAASGGGQSGYLVLAENRLSKTLARWPGDAPAWEALAKLMARANAPDRFLDAARNAVRLEPDSELRKTILAEALMTVGLEAEAESIIDGLIAANPSLVDHRLSRVKLLLNRREWSKAETACKEVLAIHPQLPEAHLYRAFCRDRLGDAAGGRAGLETAVSLAPKATLKAEFRRWYQQGTR
jgi:hypothetical protein